MSDRPTGPGHSKTQQGDAEAAPPAVSPEGRNEEPAPLAMHYCPNCSAHLEERGCKLRCGRCGYFMDCSDYY